MPFRKFRYSPNNFPNFTSGYKFNSNIDSFLYQSSSNKILNRWCLDVQTRARVSNRTRKVIAQNSWSYWFSSCANPMLNCFAWPQPQPWFSDLLGLSVNHPTQLPLTDALLGQPRSDRFLQDPILIVQVGNSLW